MSIFNTTFKDHVVPQSVTIDASGVLNLSKPGNYVVNAYSGTSDALVQVTGLRIGTSAKLSPATGDTITVTDGTYLFLGGDNNFVMNNDYDTIVLQATAVGYCKEEGRVSNG